MALVGSNVFEIGKQAPAFTLPNVVTGADNSLSELKGAKGTVVMFICNHCPFVLHVNHQLVQLANDYKEQGFSFIAISSNDVDNYPQDGPAQMKEVALELKYPFPYLYDSTQDVAKAYDAACTPDVYLFDSELKLTYHGQLDSSRPGNGIEVTGIDLRKAIDAIVNGAPALTDQKPSIGCNIKWK